MEIFRLFGSILIDSKDAENSIAKTENKAEKLVSSFGKGIKSAAKLGAGIAAGTAAAATAAAGALLKVEEQTAEFRENQAKLQTAFEASGAGADAAKKAYAELYKIMGDDGSATEASQLLAQIATNSQSVGMWTDIAAGIMGTFGDALPINGLIEAANETAKVGKVTGALADALNWAGISEDEFNIKLAELSTVEERNRLITYTLSRTYDTATEAFKANNAEAMNARDAQLQNTESMARLGETVAKVKNQIVREFSPAVSGLADAFVKVVDGTEDADEAMQLALENLVQTAVDKLPEFFDFSVDVVKALATGLIRSTPTLVEASPELIDAILDAMLDLGGEFLELGKTLMGYVWQGMISFADKQSRTRADLSASDGRLAASGFSHASGLAYVPYDNYPINAHRGEVLLNASDAGTLLDGMRTIMSSTVNAMGALCSGAVRVEIPISINGREFYRASIDDLRAVMRSDPEVA